MFAVGNNELKDKPDIGKTIICNICGEEHDIRYGKKKLENGEWVEDDLLAFFSCGGKSYLAGIGGKDIRDRFKRGEANGDDQE